MGARYHCGDSHCQLRLDSGGICGATRRLKIDHVHPHALGGAATIENARVLCRFHNQLAARRAFGDEWVEWYTARRPPGPARNGCERRPAAGEEIGRGAG